MYGAAGPPARSASAPVVRSLRRTPATGSVKKGLLGEVQPLRRLAVLEGTLGGVAGCLSFLRVARGGCE